MLNTQILLFVIIVAMMAAFIFGRWRYDVVAGVALIAAIYTGVTPSALAFDGFSHPAVISVAAVFVISRALQKGGFVDLIADALSAANATPTRQVAASGGVTVLLSSVMNNVGALALMLPVTLRNAKRARRSPSQVLIPLSFASMLGGLTTLIGTPPNLVVSGFRDDYAGAPFQLFDFTPVGLVVALAGLGYLAAIGWRLLPVRQAGSGEDGVQTQLAQFLAEMKVPVGSPLAGKPVRFVENLCDNEITIMAIIRGRDEFHAPRTITKLREGDVLTVQGDPSVWEQLCDGVRLAPSHNAAGDITLRTPDVVVAEALVMPNSPLERRSVRGIRMHDTYGVNLLALARDGAQPQSRLKHTEFRIGDMLILQGERNALDRALKALGCLTLAQREASAATRRPIWAPLALFVGVLAATAFGLVSAPIALITSAGGFVLARSLTLQEAYDAVQWPIIFLLGALIPIGEAMKSTGAASLIASLMTETASTLPIWAIIAVIMAFSMWLSDLIHNTPAAVLMAPIGVAVAGALDASIDPFLMSIAIGSSSAYLTPIGHQSNTLVLAPGGYRFTDFTRVGVGLQVIILAVATPMIMLVWPPY